MSVIFIGQINFSREPKKPRKPRQSRSTTGKGLDPKHRRSISKGLISYWDRKGRNKEEETSAKKSKGLSDKQIAIGTAFAAAGIGFALNKRFKITDKAVLKASELAYKSANSGTVGSIVNRALNSKQLPPKVKQDVANMSGASKVFLAKNVFSKRGYKLVSSDAKSNFSTWQVQDGSLMSVGSVGNNVLTFLSKKEATLKGNFPQYQMSFRVNESYNRAKTLSMSDGKKLVTQTKGMYADHTKNLPENALIRAEAWKGDNLGNKRQSIYEKKGFRELPLANDPDHIYAVKNQGKFSRIEDSQVKHILTLMDKIKMSKYSKDFIYI